MPQIQIIAPTAQQQPQRLRVAAYARVSSNSKDQLNSYAAQIRYYTNYISAHESWHFVDIYADEGITGTRADKRDDFQRMMQDCRAHKIDLILVKSVSRFARNTQDCIEAVRELRQLGVTVIFEKEHLNTGTMANEMLLSMMSAFSQEESVSISKNMHKGAAMRMQNGTYKTSTPAYGYRNDESGKLVIVPEEAEVVRYIFERFLSGDGIESIQKKLHEKYRTNDIQRIFSPTGILYVLTNERYIGDELLQKTCTNGQVPFRKHKNKGAIPQYYVHDSHESIISREEYQQVQTVLNKRRMVYDKTDSRSKSPLHGKLFCAYCDKPLWHRVKTHIIEWACPNHKQNAASCELKNISELALERTVYTIIGKLSYDHCAILQKYADNQSKIRDHQIGGSTDIMSLNKRLSELLEQNYTLNRLHAKGSIESAFFITQTALLARQIDTVKSQISQLRADGNADNILQRTNEIIRQLYESGNTEYINTITAIASKIVLSSDSCQITLVNGLSFTEKLRNL